MGQWIKAPDDVAEMLRLKACGWCAKRIERQRGCAMSQARLGRAKGS
jgi:hypothetical protein